MMNPGRKSTDKVIRLALCELRPEDAQWLITALRNAGVPTRPSPCHSLDALRELCTTKALDIFVWGEGWSEFSLEQAIEVAGAASVPVVAALSDLTASSYAQWRLTGVSDLYVRGLAELAANVILKQAAQFDVQQEVVLAREAMADTDRQCEALLEAITDPVAYLNEGLHVRANQPYLEAMGFQSFEDIEGLSLLDIVSKEDAAVVREKIKKLGRGQGVAEELSVRLSSTGESVSMSVAPAYYEGEPCLQITLRRPERSAVIVSLLPDAPTAGISTETPPPAMEEWLQREPASGLFSRPHFLDRLPSVALGTAWLLKVDRCDTVLSTLGVGQLDALMSTLGKSVAHHASDGCMVARWSPDTLALLLEDSEEASVKRAQAIQKVLGQDFLEVAGKSIPITVSMGGVSLGSLSPVDAMGHMESGLEKALEEGSGFHFFDPKAKEKAKRAHQEEHARVIRSAIVENRLVLFFQPVVSFLEGKACYEVLVRLKTPAGKLVAPSDFMPMAEALHMGHEIDEWVIREALSEISRKARHGKKVSLIIKLSSSSMISPGLSERIKSWINEKGIPPSLVWFELPLSSVSFQARAATDLRGLLKDMGCPVVLSGYGSDATSARMKDLIEPNWLKLSPEMMGGMGVDKEKQAAVRDLLLSAHQEKMKVLAPFVEDAKAMAVLFSDSVDAVQGNFISEPSVSMAFDFAQFGF